METHSNPLVSTRRIWQGAPHCAFTDLVFFAGRWLCCFRESDSHALGILGVIRVLESRDGEDWQSAYVFTDPGYDLRDPHFSEPGDGRLMINFTGRTQVNGVYEDVQSFGAFSSDGITWSQPAALEADGYWIWQIRWQEGIAYSWARKIVEGLPYGFFRSSDGIVWEQIISLEGGNETALTLLPDGRMLAFRRRNDAEIGVSAPPFENWEWHPQGRYAGGPNLLKLADGRIVAGCRYHRPNTPREEKSYFALSLLDVENLSLQSVVEFQGGQDCGYPGMVEKDGELWVSHYAGSKTDSAIFLSQVPLSALTTPTAI